jgi:hypothetical protein
MAHEELEARFAAAWEEPPEAFWSGIDQTVVARFH